MGQCPFPARLLFRKDEAVATTLPEKKVSGFIVSMHTYVDEHGRTVDEKRPCIGEPSVGFARFTSRAAVTARLPFGTATKKFDVPLPRATTVQEAFAQIADEFPAAMKQAGEDLKVEAMAQFAEQTGRQVVEAAPSDILDLEGNLRGTRGPNNKGGRPKRGRGL